MISVADGDLLATTDVKMSGEDREQADLSHWCQSLFVRTLEVGNLERTCHINGKDFRFVNAKTAHKIIQIWERVQFHRSPVKDSMA